MQGGGIICNKYERIARGGKKEGRQRGSGGICRLQILFMQQGGGIPWLLNMEQQYDAKLQVQLTVISISFH